MTIKEKDQCNHDREENACPSEEKSHDNNGSWITDNDGELPKMAGFLSFCCIDLLGKMWSLIKMLLRIHYSKAKQSDKSTIRLFRNALIYITREEKKVLIDICYPGYWFFPLRF